jgi:hypothetical protein
MRGGKRVCPADASAFCIEEIDLVVCSSFRVALRIGRKRSPPPYNEATTALSGFRLREVLGGAFCQTP